MDNGACSYRRYLDGDDQGIAEIVEEFRVRLMLYLNGFVGNYSVAEELTEETFFRLITKKPRFSGRSSFYSFLCSIGRNVAVDHLRKHGRIAATPVEEMGDYLADGEELERVYLRKERNVILYRAMQDLAVDYRAVLWLSFFEGLSNREVATALGKSERQVKNLLYRAKQSLKIKLEKEGFAYENIG
ncbi:MAG: RNA polymerase sigma factor [Clostridia bacterium]|nr:RNA polymerase sigma factor [Clostridia bacterium]